MILFRNADDPCPTCGCTYGQRVDNPDRCGRCLTGLSLDGRPIFPVETEDGMVCPTCRAIGATCRLVPSDEWPDAWQHDLSHLFHPAPASTTEETNVPVYVLEDEQ